MSHGEFKLKGLSMRKKYFIGYIQALSKTQFPFEPTENAVDGAPTQSERAGDAHEAQLKLTGKVDCKRLWTWKNVRG